MLAGFHVLHDDRVCLLTSFLAGFSNHRPKTHIRTRKPVYNRKSGSSTSKLDE